MLAIEAASLYAEVGNEKWYPIVSGFVLLAVCPGVPILCSMFVRWVHSKFYLLPNADGLQRFGIIIFDGFETLSERHVVRLSYVKILVVKTASYCLYGALPCALVFLFIHGDHEKLLFDVDFRDNLYQNTNIWKYWQIPVILNIILIILLPYYYVIIMALGLWVLASLDLFPFYMCYIYPPLVIFYLILTVILLVAVPSLLEHYSHTAKVAAWNFKSADSIISILFSVLVMIVPFLAINITDNSRFCLMQNWYFTDQNVKLCRPDIAHLTCEARFNGAKKQLIISGIAKFEVNQVSCQYHISAGEAYRVDKYQPGHNGHVIYDFVLFRQDGRADYEPETTEHFIRTEKNITVIVHTKSANLTITKLSDDPCQFEPCGTLNMKSCEKKDSSLLQYPNFECNCFDDRNKYEKYVKLGTSHCVLNKTFVNCNPTSTGCQCYDGYLGKDNYCGELMFYF